MAQALGGPGLPVGLAVALLAWLFRPGALPQLPPLELSAKEAGVKVHIIQEGGHAGDFLNLEIDSERLAQLAAGLASGKDLSCRMWTGRGALFSQAEFSRLRSALIARGLARWVSERDPRAGVMITAKGRATFAGLAPLASSPRPELLLKAGSPNRHTQLHNRR